MSPPLASVVGWAVKAQGGTGEGRRKGGKGGGGEGGVMQAPNAAAVAKPAGDGGMDGGGGGTGLVRIPAAPVAASSSVPHGVSAEPFQAFTPEIAEDLADIMPALGPLQASLKLDRPPSASQPPSADDIFAKLVEPQKHCASAARAQELRAEINSLDGVLIALQPGRDDAVRTVAANRRSDAQSELDKLEKRAPADATLASSFLEAKANYHRTVTERQERVKGGIAKAQERVASRKDFIAKLRKQLDAAELELDKVDAQNAAAFATKRAANDALDLQVLALLDAKISQHQKATQQTQVVAQESAASPQPPEGNPEMQELARVNADIQAQLQAARAELQRAQARQQAEAAFEITLEGCPEPTVAITDLNGDQEQLRAAAHLYSFFEHWAANGGNVPFTLEELKAPNVNQIPVVFQKLLGGVWEKWVSAGGGLNGSILPRQLAWMARCALVRLHNDLVLIKDTQAAAQQSYAVASQNAKKRRAAGTA